jgi:AcrR family transcriptional regulator
VTTARRLPAEERRRALLAAAARAFSAGSFAGTTTAELAREAQVSEPILYRHFGSKRELYLACVDEDWTRLRAAIEAEVAAEPDPAEWPTTVGRVVRRLHERRVLLVHFWVQALSESAGDAVIRRHMRRHMREVHGFFRDLVVRAQAAGGVPADRDADAEAWIMVGVGLVRSVSDRLGGLVPEEQFVAIGRSRSRWLSGRG